MKRNSSSSSFYDGKNDVTCGKTDAGREESSNRGRALSGNAAKPCKNERGRKKMEALRLYEGFAFPLKNNASRNRYSAIFNRAREHLFYFTVVRYYAYENHYAKRDISRCANVKPASGTRRLCNHDSSSRERDTTDGDNVGEG